MSSRREEELEKAQEETAQTIEQEQNTKNEEGYDMAIISGIVSAVVVGLFGWNFFVWMILYVLCISWLKPHSRQIVAIIIMIVLGNIIMSVLH